MLVLTRSYNQSIMIGDDIEVIVSDFCPDEGHHRVDFVIKIDPNISDPNISSVRCKKESDDTDIQRNFTKSTQKGRHYLPIFSGEKIMIGNNIKVVISGMRGGIPRIGIKAPTTIPVLRKELYTPPEENTAGAKPPPKKVILQEEGVRKGASTHQKPVLHAPIL